MGPIGATGNQARAAASASRLYVFVLLAILLGVLLGVASPSNLKNVPDWLRPYAVLPLGWAEAMKPLGDAFIKMVKMMIAPIIFCTVVHGIASMQDMRKVGSVGLKALVYFEIVTTAALAIGLLVANVWQPGAGMNIDLATLDTKDVAQYQKEAGAQSVVGTLLHIIPNTLVGAFAEGDIVQVLFVSILFGFALFGLGERGRPLLAIIDQATHVFFGMVSKLMVFAPIGAFGAMAFTIGKYGLVALLSLGKLMLGFYATCLLFIFGVLGLVAWLAGFSIFKFIAYIKEELLIVLGTSSSESVLPPLMRKMEKLGCDESVVGLVVPAGYSFNLDGTCIYLTLAALFLAQATNTDLSLVQQLSILAVLLLTSKGAAGVTGSGFIVLAATLSALHKVGPAGEISAVIPVAAIALILGVDRFMSEGRALTNLIGNGVATVVVSRWEGALDQARMRAVLNGQVAAEAPALPASSRRDPAAIPIAPGPR